MNETVGGYIHKKDGTALCVHCKTDHVRSYIPVHPESLNDGLVCSECERKLITAYYSAPPPEPEPEDDQDELELDMPEPDVFGAEEAKPKRGLFRRGHRDGST